MANYRDIIVFDFETGSADPRTCQPTQIAAVAIHARKLELQPGGFFNSEIRPIIDDDDRDWETSSWICASSQKL